MTRAGIAAVRWYREGGLEPAPSPPPRRPVALAVSVYIFLAGSSVCVRGTVRATGEPGQLYGSVRPILWPQLARAPLPAPVPVQGAHGSM